MLVLHGCLQGKTQLLYPEPQDVFPSDILPGTEDYQSYPPNDVTSWNFNSDDEGAGPL